jgi:hypothetical protein
MFNIRFGAGTVRPGTGAASCCGSGSTNMMWPLAGPGPAPLHCSKEYLRFLIMRKLGTSYFLFSRKLLIKFSKISGHFWRKCENVCKLGAKKVATEHLSHKFCPIINVCQHDSFWRKLKPLCNCSSK